MHAQPDKAALAAATELLELAQIIGDAYPNNPGTSDLDNDQPVSITLGDVRRAWRVLARVEGGAK